VSSPIVASFCSGRRINWRKTLTTATGRHMDRDSGIGLSDRAG
jgi:hypothetical protein